jgi:hypothetical protein
MVARRGGRRTQKLPYAGNLTPFTRKHFPIEGGEKAYSLAGFKRAMNTPQSIVLTVPRPAASKGDGDFIDMRPDHRPVDGGHNQHRKRAAFKGLLVLTTV